MRLRLTDHPRTRGGDVVAAFASAANVGPSPHARGRLHLVEGEADVGGTIPARAGETRVAVLEVDGRRDHPRTRGGDYPLRLAP